MREEGYYWVKYNGNWVIMKFYNHPITGPLWFESGNRVDVPESWIEEIDEKRLTHE